MVEATTSPKVTGSIPDWVTEIFQLLNSSDRTMTLQSAQPLTEMYTWDVYRGVKAAGA